MQRKFQLFAADNADMLPAIAEHAELIGQEVEHAGSIGRWAVARDGGSAGAVSAVRPGGAAHRRPAVGPGGGRRRTPGRGVAGYRGQREGLRDNPDLSARERRTRGRVDGIRAAAAFSTRRKRGRGVRASQTETAGVRLERAYSSSKRPETLNLVSRAARDYWSVVQTGFHGREGGPNTYQWTNGNATIVSPRAPGAAPKSLRVGIARARAGTPLTVTVNGCAVFNGPVGDAPWFRTFALGRCQGRRAAGAGRPHQAQESTDAGEAARPPNAGRGS